MIDLHSPSKGGNNPPNTSSARPAPPQGSGGRSPIVAGRIAMEWPEFKALCKRMGIVLSDDMTGVDLHFHFDSIPSFTIHTLARDNG